MLARRRGRHLAAEAHTDGVYVISHFGPGGTVLVMESAQLRESADDTSVRSLGCAGFRALLGQGEMLSGFKEWVTTSYL